MDASIVVISPSPSIWLQQNWRMTTEQKLLASVCEDIPHKHF
jgi:hypothetical protein